MTIIISITDPFTYHCLRDLTVKKTKHLSKNTSKYEEIFDFYFFLPSLYLRREGRVLWIAPPGKKQDINLEQKHNALGHKYDTHGHNYDNHGHKYDTNGHKYNAHEQNHKAHGVLFVFRGSYSRALGSLSAGKEKVQEKCKNAINLLLFRSLYPLISRKYSFTLYY